jgi:hypothetical protein
MSGLVGTLITKLASNAGEFDGGAPKAKGDTGKQIAGAHKSGGKDAKKGEKDSLDASQKKQQFIEDALSAQASQQDQARKGKDDLMGKYNQEVEMVTRIQLMKAEALMERDKAAAEFKAEASDFGAKATELDDWSSTYKTLRGTVDGQ